MGPSRDVTCAALAGLRARLFCGILLGVIMGILFLIAFLGALGLIFWD